jgi:hypothetical protein
MRCNEEINTGNQLLFLLQSMAKREACFLKCEELHIPRVHP